MKRIKTGLKRKDNELERKGRINYRQVGGRETENNLIRIHVLGAKETEDRVGHHTWCDVPP